MVRLSCSPPRTPLWRTQLPEDGTRRGSPGARSPRRGVLARRRSSPAVSTRGQSSRGGAPRSYLLAHEPAGEPRRRPEALEPARTPSASISRARLPRWSRFRQPSRRRRSRPGRTRWLERPGSGLICCDASRNRGAAAPGSGPAQRTRLTSRVVASPPSPESAAPPGRSHLDASHRDRCRAPRDRTTRPTTPISRPGTWRSSGTAPGSSPEAGDPAARPRREEASPPRRRVATGEARATAAPSLDTVAGRLALPEPVCNPI